jgi:hypothetical protein
MGPRIINDDVTPPPVVETISEEAWQIGCGVLALFVGVVAALMMF